MRSFNIREQRTRKSMKHSLRLKESRMKKKGKFKDLESFKRKLQIDKQK